MLFFELRRVIVVITVIDRSFSGKKHIGLTKHIQRGQSKPLETRHIFGNDFARLSEDNPSRGFGGNCHYGHCASAGDAEARVDDV